jgi:hypothetical protein
MATLAAEVSMKHGAIAILVSLLCLAPMTGTNAASLIDFVGFSYETGAFPPSNIGDDLNFVAVIDGLTPPLSWNPADFEYTMHLTDLVSTGEEHPDPNNIVVSYNGGTLSMHEDSAFNADPGVNPPNATAPGTYIDGALYLEAEIQELTVFYNTQFLSGAFEAEVTFTGGGHFLELGLQTTGYSFGGIFQFGSPEGYDMQWDGQILLDPVAVEATTWGSIKSRAF